MTFPTIQLLTPALAVLAGSKGKLLWDAVIGLDGAVYATDARGTGIVRIADGKATPLAGGEWSVRPVDGKGKDARFTSTGCITQDPDTGHLYISDGHRCIRRVTLDGDVKTIAGAYPRLGSSPINRP